MIAIEPETKISQCIIQDKQALKSRTAYHYGKSVGCDSIRSSAARNRKMMEHPDQDKDILPLESN